MFLIEKLIIEFYRNENVLKYSQVKFLNELFNALSANDYQAGFETQK